MINGGLWEEKDKARIVSVKGKGHGEVWVRGRSVPFKFLMIFKAKDHVKPNFQEISPQIILTDRDQNFRPLEPLPNNIHPNKVCF